MIPELKIGLDFSAPILLHTDISSGIFIGFEVDMMELIGEKLGVKLNYQVSLWADILQKLKHSDIDLICSAVTVTGERAVTLDFSDPYLSFRLCAVDRRSGEKRVTAAQLTAKKIGARRATEAEKYITTHFADSTMIVSDTNEPLYGMVNDGSIDLLIDDSPIAGAFVPLYDKLEIACWLPDTGSHYAIAIKKNNTDLKNAINTVLAGLRRNGSWQGLYDKWFGDSEL